MKKLLSIIAMTALITSCGNSKNQASLKIKNSKIVGGSEVDITRTDLNYIVRLGEDCSGMIINEKWILTAAHCEAIFDLPITAGTLDIYSPHGITLKMKDYHIHPKHRSFDYGDTYDFALIELQEKIDFKTSRLKPIEIITPEFAQMGGLAEGKMTTVYGWGATTEDGRFPHILHEVSVPLVSRERGNASDSYDGRIDESMILAGIDEGGKDACQGDSGGPLVLDEKGKKLLIGVVSWGEGCARPNYYGVYSNVAVAYPWIQKIINE